MQEREQSQRHRKLTPAASRRRKARSALATLFLLAPVLALYSQAPLSDASLPQAPQPQTATTAPPKTDSLPPCPVQSSTTSANAATPTQSATPSITSSDKVPAQNDATEPCKSPRSVNWFARFLNGPSVKPLSAKEKARLAVRNLLDPFNAITIAGQSGITVASDSHSPYGPGMPGFGRNVGVSYAEDATGEFFGTFLIPSIAHQDPHYHRMPTASIRRRAFHAAFQILWTRGDNGRGMINYANLLGSAIDLGISNLYVPGEQTHLSADLTRYAIGIATDPIDNYITEFLPDVARRIHVRIVLVQRIINQVATTEGGGTP